MTDPIEVPGRAWGGVYAGTPTPRARTRKEYWARRREPIPQAPTTEDEEHPADPIVVHVSVHNGNHSTTLDYALSREDRADIVEALMIASARLATRAYEQVETRRLSDLNKRVTTWST